jgi:formylglycine-generating enzyme required for sulfatase activity
LGACRGGLYIPGPGGALRDNALPGRLYPWGGKFDNSKCNTDASGVGDTTPVGKFSPRGDSPYGVADMAGNVWEWCNSLNNPYPYNAKDGREELEASGLLLG